MTGFLRLLAAERLKLSKSFIWLLVPISPLVSLAIGLLVSLDNVDGTWKYGSYAILASSMASFHAMLFLPILTGIFTAFVCRYEHGGGGWKMLLALPVSRTALFFAKFTVVASLILVTQLLFLAAVVYSAHYQGIDGAIPWRMLLTGVGGGFLACLPLAALQLLVSVGWSSFAAPLAINVALTVPNMLVINSATYGPFYPWAQPMLAMLWYSDQDFGGFSLPLENIFMTVAGSFALFLAAGLIYFNRKEI
ncbi:ABC transporter permease [Paenibacillus arenilitoris]|uniref:ABC transporter permease n=1 Tax=Paenibacillus arenilitoris TaxID=2772299 RepID=A0A927CT49_9BACL|nr:ABC transporter permease [Paenibacillus arenilitoris]MBD2872438.1 ABC transporter permease [Paenibacillus arenilitoris]